MKVFAIIVFGLAVIRTYAMLYKNKRREGVAWWIGALTTPAVTTWVYIWWLTTIID